MSDLYKVAEQYIRPGTVVPVDIETTAILVDLLRQALAMKKFSEVNQEIEEALKQPKWVGLEDEDVATVKNEFNRGALWAEQVLKEKNKREWVGLTDEEGAEIWGDAHDLDWNRLVTPKEIVKRIEAKLKKKNT